MYEWAAVEEGKLSPEIINNLKNMFFISVAISYSI